MPKLSNKNEWITKKGVLADAFPIESEITSQSFELEGTYAEITNNFSSNKPSKSPFENSGVMIDRKIITAKVTTSYNGAFSTLSDVLIDEKDVPIEFFTTEESLKTWQYLKGAKKEERTTALGHIYYYAEGAMTFPDALDKPSRTIITGEGGAGASRFKHVIKTPSGKYRRLTPIELERLDMFPDNHTQFEGTSDGRRAFFIGNALVVGAIQRVGESLKTKLS